MKKSLLAFFSLLLVVTMLLASFSSVKASPGDPPVVTPISGDMEFTTEVVPIAFLPGTTQLPSQMLVPVGFPAGEAQFEDPGVLVKGMESGKANACFALSTVAVNQGWGGKVGVWNGFKWMLLPTTITSPEDSPTSFACAVISGNGIYAFIKYVTSPEKIPSGKPHCVVTLLGIFTQGLDGGGARYFNMLGVFPNNPLTPITYTIIDPSLSITGDLDGTVLSNDSGFFDFSGYEWQVTQSVTFTVRLETPICYHDWVENYQLILD